MDVHKITEDPSYPIPPCMHNNAVTRCITDEGGVVGPPGPEGPQGPEGPPGPKGDTGSQGERGIAGSNGSQGVAGPQGPQGQVGPQGPQGPEGPRGPSGRLIGSPQPWLVATIPDGYLEFNGQAISAGQYPILSGLFGSNLPDLRAKFLFGADGTRAPGATGGEEAHTLTAAEAAQKAVNTGNDSPDHTHNGGSLSVTNWAQAATGGSIVAMPATTLAGTYTFKTIPTGANDVTGNTGGASARHAHSVAGSDAANAHNNMPPFRAVRWITEAG